MSDQKFDENFQKAYEAAGDGMDADSFIKMILANVKKLKWLSGHYNVNGHRVGLKAYGLWIQRLEVAPHPYRDSGMYIKTQKAMRAWLEKALVELGVARNGEFGRSKKASSAKVADMVIMKKSFGLGAGVFYTGHGWSPEYPDARLYDDRAAVRKVVDKINAEFIDKPDHYASVIKGYGTDDEVEFLDSRAL